MSLLFLSLLACSDFTQQPVPVAKIAEPVRLRGRGASFPAPVYASWARHFQEMGNPRLVYQATSSGDAVDAATRAAFGATDIALAPTELDAAGLVQFPVVIGGVAIVTHLEDVGPGDLALTAELVGRIYSGEITTWDDDAISALNPHLALPSRDIVAIRRTDTSGTAAMFSAWLDRESGEWGARDTTDPTPGVGATSNTQVQRFIEQFRDTIGFVESSRAIKGELAWTKLVDPDGTVHSPVAAEITQAAQAGTFDEECRFHPARGVGWPIVGASYALVRRDPENAVLARQVLRFFHTGWTGHDTLPGFSPIPESQQARAEQRWADQVRVGGLPVWEIISPPAPQDTAAPEGD